jgi:hypothetical protein
MNFEALEGTDFKFVFTSPTAASPSERLVGKCVKYILLYNPPRKQHLGKHAHNML